MAVKDELTKSMATFGFMIIQTLVTDIEPDHKVKDAMNEINSAQRFRYIYPSPLPSFPSTRQSHCFQFTVWHLHQSVSSKLVSFRTVQFAAPLQICVSTSRRCQEALQTWLLHFLIIIYVSSVVPKMCLASCLQQFSIDVVCITVFLLCMVARWVH